MKGPNKYRLIELYSEQRGRGMKGEENADIGKDV
jgi:hypothetical protein